MKSPFIGMNPWLEGYIWPDVHQDLDIVLELDKAMNIIFERGLYHLSMDYTKEPPPPAFSEQDRAWIKQVVEENE